MRQKIFILSLLIVGITIIVGCSNNNINVEKEGIFSIEDFNESEKEYFDSQEEYFTVNSIPNGVSFEAKFSYDTCKYHFSYVKEGNNLKIIKNLQVETCVDMFSYTGIKGKIEDLPKGDYKLSINYKYDKSINGENTESEELLSKDIKIK